MLDSTIALGQMSIAMKKRKAAFTVRVGPFRFAAKHARLVKRWAKSDQVSESEVLRELIDRESLRRSGKTIVLVNA